MCDRLAVVERWTGRQMETLWMEEEENKADSSFLSYLKKKYYFWVKEMEKLKCNIFKCRFKAYNKNEKKKTTKTIPPEEENCKKELL